MFNSDRRILLDQFLIKMNQPPMVAEELAYLKDLDDEIDMALAIMGFNRKNIRQVYHAEKKKK